MQWKDHFRELEKMRDITSPSEEHSHQRYANGGSLKDKIKELVEHSKHSEKSRKKERDEAISLSLYKMEHGHEKDSSNHSSKEENNFIGQYEVIDTPFGPLERVGRYKYVPFKSSTHQVKSRKNK